MFDYDKDAQRAAEILDQYDLNETLRSCFRNGQDDVHDVIDVIGYKFPELKEVLEDLTTEEFVDYINNKTNYGFWEYIAYRLHS